MRKSTRNWTLSLRMTPSQILLMRGERLPQQDLHLILLGPLPIFRNLLHIQLLLHKWFQRYRLLNNKKNILSVKVKPKRPFEGPNAHQTSEMPKVRYTTPLVFLSFFFAIFSWSQIVQNSVLRGLNSTTTEILQPLCQKDLKVQNSLIDHSQGLQISRRLFFNQTNWIHQGKDLYVRYTW